MMTLPSSFPPNGATSKASTPGNCARMERQVLAEPPRVRVAECARTTAAGSGWVDRESVCVRKSVPHATTRTERWPACTDMFSWVSRRNRPIAGAMLNEIPSLKTFTDYRLTEMVSGLAMYDGVLSGVRCISLWKMCF
jgi:hypothetical protein